jgi:lipopolysaccharide/colanic/teichoic acid biosynthesis glycosyltransferase
MTRVSNLLTPLVTAVVVLAAAVLHARFIGHYPITEEPRFGWVLVLIGLIWLTSYAVGVTEHLVSGGARLLRASGAVGSAVVVVSLIQLVSRKPLLPLFVLGISVLSLIPVMALAAAASERGRVYRGQQERAVVLVGVDEQERLRTEAARAPERPVQLACIVAPKEALPTEADPSPLETLVRDHSATLLVLDREAQGLDEVVAQAARLHSHGIRIRTLSLFYDEWLGKLPISELERIALLFDINEIHRPLYARMKRFMDVTIASVGTLVLALTIPVVIAVDLIGNRGPLFYRQPRVGKDGQVFTILKFRTMKPGEGPTQWTSEDDPRLTSVGRLLRRLHVDELPQVLNVLRRDLSIVGPRPEQPRYVEQLTAQIPFYDTRHLVRPGITGWAQVKYDYGATELDALEKLQYEFYYLRHQSLALDLRITGRTLRSIVGRQGR